MLPLGVIQDRHRQVLLQSGGREVVDRLQANRPAIAACADQQQWEIRRVTLSIAVLWEGEPNTPTKRINSSLGYRPPAPDALLPLTQQPDQVGVN